MNGADEPTDNDAAARRQGYLEWLDSEIAGYEQYHNHKETMAWSATAAYLSVLVLAYAAAPRLAHHLRAQAGFSLLLVAVAYVTSMFVNMQFQMRWTAADLITALRRVKGKLLNMSADQFERLDLTVPAVDQTPTVEKANWPAFVQDEINLCTTVWQPFCKEIMLYLLPWIIIKWREVNPLRGSKLASWVRIKKTVLFLFPCISVRFRWRNINARARSELASYAVILAVTVIAIACVLDPWESDIDSRLRAIEEALRK